MTGPAGPAGPEAATTGPAGSPGLAASADPAGSAGRTAATRPAGPVRRWRAELAWLPGQGILPDVLIEAAGDRFAAITPRAAPGHAPGATRLPGLTLPGLANAHSHAFHRGLRGITQAGQGTFWTWRERMYQDRKSVV